MIRRLLAPAIVLLLCLGLGACASFSGFVSDNWPTWAGGMPKDVPPRPGAPGYEEFIAHQQQSQVGGPPPPAAAPPPPGSAPGTATAAAPGPVAVAPSQRPPLMQPAPAAQRPADDRGVVNGGLY
jgi:hypothetical protein